MLDFRTQKGPESTKKETTKNTNKVIFISNATPIYFMCKIVFSSHAYILLQS